MLILLVEEVDLHPDPGVAPVLGSVQKDAGVHPALDEELAAEIEILVLFLRPEPGGEIGPLMDHDGPVLHVECRGGAFADGPAASERPSNRDWKPSSVSAHKAAGSSARK